MKTILQLLVVAPVAIGFSGCTAGCGSEPIASIASPSGSTKAVVFNRNCGATTGFNTQVPLIRSSKQLPNAVGNALTLDGTVPLAVTWRSDSELSIVGLGSARVSKREQSVAGVKISYGN